MGWGALAGALGWLRGKIPSASLRAGSSLRLRNGYAQDDKVVHMDGRNGDGWDVAGDESGATGVA